jgi:hypothetical protein
MAPPFHTWLITNLGRVMILKKSPNDDKHQTEMRLFTLGGRRHFQDFQFYLTKDEDVNFQMLQIDKYLQLFSDDISEWKTDDKGENNE